MPTSIPSGRVICFGDLCVDIVARTPENHSPLASDTTVEQLSIRVAGAAVNCALAAARAGAPVDVVGLIGADVFGDMILRELAAAQVGASHVQRHASEQTGIIISQVRPTGDRSFLSYRGANTQPYGTIQPGLVSPADYLYLCGFSLQSQNSAQTALALKNLGAKVLFDPTYLFARDFFSHYKNHLAGTFVLTPNLEEAQLMTGQSDPASCAAALCDLGVETVIVKLGPAGCFLQNGPHREHIPTQPASGPTDTTGAGDTFCGTLLAHCLLGADLLTAATHANEAARRLVCR